MKKAVMITVIMVALTSVALIIFVRLISGKETQVRDLAEAKKGTFEIDVSGSGELMSETTIDITGPDIVQNTNFRVSPIKITDLVPEGTIVRKGQYIATLDKTKFNNTFKDESDLFKTLQSELQMKILDSAVTLSTLRDDIINQTFSVEEAGIIVEQSKFDAPAVQRKSQLELDKSKRFLEWKQRFYFLRYVQTVSEIKNLKKNVEWQRSKVTDLEKVLAGFTVTAPSDGMVIYKKDRLGARIKTGSFVNPFNLVVANLSELSDMVSRVYVSEIDVSKVKCGQPVELAVDAFQGKTFTGVVTSIANIGEQLANSDTKVFEVLIKIDGYNPMLRPSMTTSNKVITKTLTDVVYVPLESVQAGTDNIPYVYTKEGTKQVVITGESNDKNIIIEKGLVAGRFVWLGTPEKFWKFELAGNELASLIKETEMTRKIEVKSMKNEKELITELNSDKKVFSFSSGDDGQEGATGGF